MIRRFINIILLISFSFLLFHDNFLIDRYSVVIKTYEKVSKTDCSLKKIKKENSYKNFEKLHEEVHKTVVLYSSFILIPYSEYTKSLPVYKYLPVEEFVSGIFKPPSTLS